MVDIKIITEETDFSKINMHKVNWDLEFDEIPYDIYHLDNYYHTIGGKYGNNDYWCCPSDENPSLENLIAFNGQAPIWGVEYKQKNSYRTKWGESSIIYNGICVITRNGKAFYGFGARTMEYGLAKAQTLLTEIQEHAIEFHSRNWKEEVIGRKIYYREQPAIIEKIYNIGEGEMSISIVPDKKYIDIFERPVYMQEPCEIEYYEEGYKNGVKDDILTPNIYWYRDDNK